MYKAERRKKIIVLNKDLLKNCLCVFLSALAADQDQDLFSSFLYFFFNFITLNLSYYMVSCTISVSYPSSQ